VIDRLSENRETVSLAILDWSMPGHEGTEMLSQIHEIAPDLPIIICSSYMGDYFSDLPEGHSHAYIQKSYTPTQLIELVNKMLGN
jgi:DNA-binding NarL/FixJ family response regulator